MSSKASLNGYLNQTSGYFKEIGGVHCEMRHSGGKGLGAHGDGGGINGRGMGPS